MKPCAWTVGWVVVGLLAGALPAQDVPADAPPPPAPPPAEGAAPPLPLPADGEPLPPPNDPYLNMDMPRVFSRSIAVEGFGTVKYLACQPARLVPDTQYPLLLALPAGDGSEAMAQAGLDLYWARPGTTRGFIVVTPIAPKGSPFNREGADLVAPFLKAICNDMPIDTKLVFLAGVGNGGVGALRVALDNPTRLAGLIGVPLGYRDAGWLDSIAKLGKLPCYLRIGGQDESPFKRMYDQLTERMRAASVPLNAAVLAGQGSALDLNLVDLFDWMDQLKKRELDQRKEGALPSLVIPSTRPAARPATQPAK